MRESELAGKATTVIKLVDKLVSDFRRDTVKLLAALKELKKLNGDSGDKEKGE